MPRNGSVTLSDLAARGIDRIVIACPTCGRRGEYDLGRLMDRHGDAMLTSLRERLTSDCERGRSANVYDRCGAVFVGL